MTANETYQIMLRLEERANDAIKLAQDLRLQIKDMQRTLPVCETCGRHVPSPCTPDSPEVWDFQCKDYDDG